jgi:hypothetical protein
MATSLTLKNLPNELLEGLRDAAEEERRSINQEAIHLLTEALRARRLGGPAYGTFVQGQVSRWRELAGQWQSDKGAAEETDELYASRSGGRKVDR